MNSNVDSYNMNNQRLVFDHSPDHEIEIRDNYLRYRVSKSRLNREAYFKNKLLPFDFYYQNQWHELNNQKLSLELSNFIHMHGIDKLRLII